MYGETYSQNIQDLRLQDLYEGIYRRRFAHRGRLQ
jgi:hypothetical protein